MEKDKQAKLASKGWKIGTVNEFLELTPAEATYIELRLALSENLKQRRIQLNFSQIEKLETGEVTLDFLIRALLTLGTTVKELAEIMVHSQDFAGNPTV
ncbi:MAG: transcriptional regulator [Gammaproteobacteria bacterium]|nr:MAG: transcriptional regulator [Gammaproteobacteria bacterium]RKZ72057.1 MAG: transcriptional regulator [Gammaproteobacteria bacterium]